MSTGLVFFNHKSHKSFIFIKVRIYVINLRKLVRFDFG